MEKVITKVKSPIDRDNRLTKNKVYDAKQTVTAVPIYGRAFTLIDDVGESIICNEFVCAHLKGGNWIVVEEV